jgi:hypothetical protein
MTTIAPDPTPTVRSTPWHLWLAGGLSLLWNAFGAFDWTMSHVRGEAYFRQSGMSEAQIAAFHTYPSWMELFWALGVWGAVMGSVMLLFRSRWAVPALAASLLGAAVNLLYATALARPTHLDPITVVITFVAVLLIWYAWFMNRRGTLA